MLSMSLAVVNKPNPIPLPSDIESCRHRFKASASVILLYLSFSASDALIPIPSSAIRIRNAPRALSKYVIVVPKGLPECMWTLSIIS